MDICLLWVSCVVRWRSLRRADRSSRGVLPTVVCRVWSINLVNEAMTRVGSQRHKKKCKMNTMHVIWDIPHWGNLWSVADRQKRRRQLYTSEGMFTNLWVGLSRFGLDYQRKNNSSHLATLSRPALGRKNRAFQW